MNHSITKVSDMLNDLVEINNEIQSTLLIGEKVAMIYEAGQLYNHMKALITPDYLSDEEFEYLKGIAKNWNDDVLEYAKQQNGNLPPEAQDNLDDLEDQIREALDDLMKGFDGDTGKYTDNDGEKI